LYQYLKEDSSILEIGPGYGHWTEELIPRAAHITLVDLVPKCIEACADRFQRYSNISYHVNDGMSLRFVKKSSVDFVFSMDCFIQIPPSIVLGYLRQIYKILKVGGIGLIHHAKNGEKMTGWRSDMTDKKMIKFCELCNLVVLEQMTSWENGKFEIWPKMDCDVVTIFKKLQ
jgi:ubiquinone/menaquinone biosynthesis C-methylase UbiE